MQTVWAPKCCKLRCFMNVPCIWPATKRPPPQLKLTCVSASGKIRPFAPTARADLSHGWRVSTQSTFYDRIQWNWGKLTCPAEGCGYSLRSEDSIHIFQYLGVWFSGVISCGCSKLRCFCHVFVALICSYILIRCTSVFAMDDGLLGGFSSSQGLQIEAVPTWRFLL